MMIQLFKTIRSYLRVFSERRLIKKNVMFDFLECGKYYITCNGKTLMYKDDTPTMILDSFYGNVKRGILPLVISKKNKNKKIDFNGQIVLSTFSGYCYFDYKEQKKLTIFNSKEESDIILKSISSFSPFFNITYTIVNDFYCIEKMVINYPRKKWTNSMLVDCYYKLFISYINYLAFNSNKVVIKSIKETLNNSIDDNLTSDFYSLYKNLICNLRLSDVGYYVYSHGDLHFGNTLLEDEKLYLIDFDKVCYEVFYFDLFHIMYVEFIEWDNTALLDLYLEKDEFMLNLFRRLFAVLNVKFEDSLIHDYMKVFILSKLVSMIQRVREEYEGERMKDNILRTVFSINRFYNYIH